MAILIIFIATILGTLALAGHVVLHMVLALVFGSISWFHILAKTPAAFPPVVAGRGIHVVVPVVRELALELKVPRSSLGLVGTTGMAWLGLIGLGLVGLELSKRGMTGIGMGRRVLHPVHVEVRVRPRGIHLDVHVGFVDDDGGGKMGGLDPAPVGLVVIVMVDGFVIDLAGRVIPVGIVGDVGVLICGPRTEMKCAGGKEHGQGKGQPGAEDRVFHKASWNF
jgi:hypothetical protein